MGLSELEHSYSTFQLYLFIFFVIEIVISINAHTAHTENLLTVFSAAHVVVWLQLPADGATSRS